MHHLASTDLKKVLDELKVPADSNEWFVTVCPSSRKTNLLRTVSDVSHLNLTQVGVAFGSVLILEYKPAAEKHNAPST